MNFVDAAVVAHNGVAAVRLADGTVLALPAARAERLAERRDRPVLLGLRPEHISRAGPGVPRPGLARHIARIDLLLPTGARTYATFALGGAAVVAELQAHDVSQPGEQVEVAIDMNRAVLIDQGTERVLA
jgi:multiple sugar transport system ATP-binding protein